MNISDEHGVTMAYHQFEYTPTDGAGNTIEVAFGNDIAALTETFAARNRRFHSPIFLIDQNLPESYLMAAETICGMKATNVVRIDPEHKTIDRIMKIWHQMVLTVPDGAVVIGGGTTSDLAGFACANYQRGIPRYLFPTTLLSMVDASIGGKSGIDFAEVKNSVGAIHYPLATVNYLPFLTTLDHDEYRSGFAEIIKAAVLYDRSFFDKLEDFSRNMEGPETDAALAILGTSSRIKARVCEDHNKKKVSLLYGHSVGHAIERYREGHLRHGDCVAIGMTIEGAMACRLGVWTEAEWRRQQDVIERIGLPSRLPDYIKLETLASKMLLYKKLVSPDDYLFSLPEQIGSIHNHATTYLTPVKREDMAGVLRESVDWIKQRSGSTAV